MLPLGITRLQYVNEYQFQLNGKNVVIHTWSEGSGGHDTCRDIGSILYGIRKNSVSNYATVYKSFVKNIILPSMSFLANLTWLESYAKATPNQQTDFQPLWGMHIKALIGNKHIRWHLPHSNRDCHRDTSLCICSKYAAHINSHSGWVIRRKYTDHAV